MQASITQDQYRQILKIIERPQPETVPLNKKSFLDSTNTAFRENYGVPCVWMKNTQYNNYFDSLPFYISL